MTNNDDFEVFEDNDLEDGKDKFDFDFSWHGSSSWSWGIILIILGVAFLLNNMGYHFVRLDNWWALFILAPGLSMIASSFRYYREKNKFSRRARTRGFIGLLLSAFAVSLFFSISMTYIGPALLVVFGIYLLLRK